MKVTRHALICDCPNGCDMSEEGHAGEALSVVRGRAKSAGWKHTAKWGDICRDCAADPSCPASAPTQGETP